MTIWTGLTTRAAVVIGLAVAIGAGGLSACRPDGAALPPLSEAGQAGRTLYVQGGCAGCHGSQASGGAGPPLVGLYGTEVELDDGTTVIADVDYLTRAIADPKAERAKGYDVVMPDNRLTDEQISQVIDFIEEIGPSAVATESGDDSGSP